MNKAYTTQAMAKQKVTGVLPSTSTSSQAVRLGPWRTLAQAVSRAPAEAAHCSLTVPGLHFDFASELLCCLCALLCCLTL